MAGTSPLRSRKGLSVLIIDDDAAVTEVFSLMLSLEGYDVVTATSAENGLTQAANPNINAILLDLRMPNLDGVAFLQRLRAQEIPHAPVAMVTGDYFVDENVLSVLRDFGVKLYFKPLWIEDLIHITQELLRVA